MPKRAGLLDSVRKNFGTGKTVRQEFERKDEKGVEKWEVTFALRPLSIADRLKLGFDKASQAKHLLYCEGKICRMTEEGKSECHFTLEDYGGDLWSIQQVAVDAPKSWAHTALLSSPEIYANLRDKIFKV